MRDNLFNANIDIADFRFDKEVVEVFDVLVRRSVQKRWSVNVNRT